MSEMSSDGKKDDNVNLLERKSAEKFMDQYIEFAAKMRPDLAMIEDPKIRDDEIINWMNTMEEPEKLMMDFMQTNPMNVNAWNEDFRRKGNEALARVDEVKSLPIQDTIWMIDEYTELKDDDGQTHRILMIADTKGLIQGTLMRNVIEVPFVKHCKDLVCVCALQPMVGKPRRPRLVTFKEPSSAEKAKGLDLSDLGIKYMYDGMDKEEEEEPVRMRECSVCRLRGSKELFKRCSSCQALLYCSKECQKTDWNRKGKMAAHCHKLWCKRMKTYMSKTDQLRKLPFTFAEETTSEDFDMVAYKSFLEKQGVLDQGVWRRECRLHDKDTSCYCEVPFGELPEVDDLVVLPVESTVLDEAPEFLPPLLQDWEAYYKYRGFRMDSPIAIPLHWPLTLYYITKICYPNDFPEFWESIDCNTLYIDIIGVEREVEMLPLFKELGFLIPDSTLDIVMYGVEISKSVNQKTYEHQNVKVTVVHGPYHKRALEGRKPHFAIGLNAGLGAYQLWCPTLVKLRTDKTPAYFTDYCQYSCECAKTAIEGLNLGTTSTPIINPFRKPVRKLAEENDMPWYSNGFLYHLVYSVK